jgi:heme A synthase
LRRVGIAATAFSFALVAWGAIVRINGAGMTCPDWPRCRGVWFPALDPKVVYEVSHRWGAGALTIIVVVTFAAAWIARAQAPAALRAAWVCVGLIVAQVAAGWLTIVRQNDPPSVALHLVLGFSMFVALLAVTLFAFLAGETDAPPPSSAVARWRMSNGGFARLALASTLLAFAAVFAAGYMSASNDGLACTGFPLCAGFAGAQTPDQQIHMGHRFAAYATILAVIVTWLAAVLTRRSDRGIVTMAWISVGLVLLQATLGVLAVISSLNPVLRSLHEANGALLVGALAVQTILAFRAAALEPG